MRFLAAAINSLVIAGSTHVFASAQAPFALIKAEQVSASQGPLLDPLAGLYQAFGHSSGRSFVMPVTPSDSSTSELTTSNSSHKYQWNYEINKPTRILHGAAESHTIQLATRSFAHSYGKPFIGEYSPNLLPARFNDPKQWVFIELTLSGNVSGRQFDRLGSIQLDGVEVLRTDNPEPSKDGVQWSFTKEMNRYYDLWRKERILVFDFPNIVNDVYTGALNMTLSLTVYIANASNFNSNSVKMSPLSLNYARILPLSKRSIKENAFFHLGENGDDDGITHLRCPSNAKSALVEIYASGTANDEFWYTNVPDRFYEEVGPKISKFGLFPRGPLREIQLWIDDRLAGVAYPFPIIFTGGISPYFWRPMVAYGAYNQPTYYIDITPFLGILSNDAEHKFQLKVISAEKNNTILAWFLSGNVQFQLDTSSKRTIGHIIKHDTPSCGDFSTSGHVAPDFNKSESLSFQVQGTRTISIKASIQPGSSVEPYEVNWNQNIYFNNYNRLKGNVSHTEQLTTGQSVSNHNNDTFYQEDLSYSLALDSVGYNFTLKHEFEQELTYGQNSTFKEPRHQHTSVTQQGKANMTLNNEGHLSGGNGQTEVEYSYRDSENNTYTHNNTASNGMVSRNFIGGSLQNKAIKV